MKWTNNENWHLTAILEFLLAYSGFAFISGQTVIISATIKKTLKFNQPGDGLFAEESSKAPARSRELGRSDNDENTALEKAVLEMDYISEKFQKAFFHTPLCWKMTGGTPEVRSDKSLTLLTFNIWHSTNGPMDQ